MKLQRLNLRWFVAAGFLLQLVVCIFMVFRMPVFSHIDEVAHFDYALKIANGAVLGANQPLEANVAALWVENCEVMNRRYVEPTMRLDCAAPSVSAEIMQPSFTYRIASLVVRIAGAFNGDTTAQLLALRIMCAVMLVVANVLVYLGLRLINPRAAVLGLAWLIGFVQVDLLRFSNDTPAMLAGAGTFFFLVKLCRAATWGNAAGAGLFFALAALSKLTALVFLGAAVGVTLLLFFQWMRFRELFARIVMVFAPASAVMLLIFYANYRFSGSISGISEEAASTAPEGWTLLRRLGSAAVWQWWHETWLTIETMVGGRRGIDVYPVQVLVTWALLGQALALGAVVFLRQPDKPDDSRNHGVRWIAAGLLATLAVQVAAVLILGLVGKIWLAGRMLSPVSAWPLTAICLGYVMALSQIRTATVRRSVFGAIWLWVFLVGVLAAREYLRLRAY